METLRHIVKSEHGIHARPAGKLAQKVREYRSKITVEKEGKAVSAAKVIGIMSLGAKKGDPILFSIEGSDEKEALFGLKEFCDREL